MQITVVGLGYVGLANAAMLAREHRVRGLDTDMYRVNVVNDKHSTVADQELDLWINTQPLRLWATAAPTVAYADSDFVIVAVPTSYDESTGQFDTSIVEDVVHDAIRYAPRATVVIRSTVPVGFTEDLQRKYLHNPILFVPEFLREGHALEDTLHPSRVVIGAHPSDIEKAREFGDMLVAYSGKGYTVMKQTEAEAVKLFSNTYLAMRVGFFNELDTYAAVHRLDSKAIIEAVSADPRIGRGYNNPSFGYGGYCLPKDAKQLRANYAQIPQELMTAIVDSNLTRKEFIAEEIEKLGPENAVIGIYRLTAKTDSDNFRDSAVLDIIDLLKEGGSEMVIYEPELADNTYRGIEVLRDLDEFTARSDLIVANRNDDRLSHVQEKVYTRDIFKRD